jgi:hypothetical protein
MKSVFFPICLLLVVNCALGQQTDRLPLLSCADYLQKSKRQKAGAWLLAGTGGAILLMTLGKTMIGQISNNPPAFPVFPVLLGAGSIVGSISLFNASAQNRRMARDISVEFNMQRATIVQTAVLETKHFPTVALKMRW